MVRIKIRAIGKIKEPYIREAISDYSKRIQSFCPLDCIEYPESPVSGSHPSSINQAIQSEGVKLLSGLDMDDYVIVLDGTGKKCSSEKFAEIIGNCEINGPYVLIFLIGGPNGLSDRCKKRADCVLSLSPMTFPHQVARLILYEQVYRAFTILRGLPYHR
ncbi:MAG: 23S rRNA (pseudouridine(1915)-N(3))-methyltransferase RlmH [Methanomicrobiales archaeon]|nr:23S rRNA (pseudouridine(1915)-N(3))-methyltransferase RlmH [Methanomicrobiales archaeon]